MRPIYRLAVAAAVVLAALLVVLWLVRPTVDSTHVHAAKATSIGAHRTTAVPEIERIRSRTDAWSRTDELPGPLAISGTVIDEHARPVAGAVVSLSSQPPRSVTTAADGTWSFSELLPRPYKLEAHKDDAFARLGNVVPAGQPITLRLVAGADVRVRVVAAGSGAPIAGARVQIRGDDSSAATTDDAGWVRFRGAPPVEAFAIVASKHGWSTTRATVAAGLVGRDAQVFQVELAQAVSISGRVVDQSGRAIASAAVVAQPVDAPTPIDVATDGVRTDAHGEFTLSDIAPGNVTLRAYHPEFRSGPGTAVTAQSGAASAQITITLHRAVSVSGRVVDSHGQPAPWAEVHAYVEKQAMWNDTGGRHLVADAAGEFRIDGLAPTAVRIVASTAEEASAHPVHVDLSGNRDVTDLVLSLDLHGAISGTVVDSHHAPVAGASVTCQPVDAQRVAVRCPGFAVTDASGRFHLGGLGDGSYKLVAMRASGSRAAAETIARTGDTAVQLVATETGSITGRLRFADGTAPERARIELQPGRGLAVSIGSDGAFTIDQVEAGAYMLLATGAFVPVTKPGVTVVAGGHVDLGAISIERGNSLEGTVVDESGASVAGARVTAGSNLGSVDVAENLGVHLDAASTTTDDHGHFYISNMPSGATSVVADHRHRGRSLPVPPTSAPMTLVLHPGAALEGSVAGTDPRHRCFVSLDAPGGIHYGAACDERGNYRIAQITEGEYRATVQGPQRLAGTARSLTLAAGQTLRVDF